MPTPTPILTWLLLGRVLDEGVILDEGVVPVAAGESNSPDDVDGVERVSMVGLEELVVAVVIET